MLIRINHSRWLNFDLGDICGITITRSKIKADKSERFVISFEFAGYTETSDFFSSFDEAEKFALELVADINSEGTTNVRDSTKTLPERFYRRRSS